MKLPPPLHVWPRTALSALKLQSELAGRVRVQLLERWPRRIAGLDAAASPDGAFLVGGVVLWDLKTARVLEQHTVWRRARFPYVPGLLSFRETPVLLAALRRLRQPPDLLLCDGQGVAHPRRFGLASHLGVLCDLPAIGCAKSRLCGQAEEPPPHRGAFTELKSGNEIIGAVLRTQAGIKPVYVSVGHRCDLLGAIAVVLACTTRYRLPEPTRLADRQVAHARLAAPDRPRTRPT